MEFGLYSVTEKNNDELYSTRIMSPYELLERLTRFLNNVWKERKACRMSVRLHVQCYNRSTVLRVTMGVDASEFTV